MINIISKSQSLNMFNTTQRSATQYNTTLFQHGKVFSTLVIKIQKIITTGFQDCRVGVILHITIVLI